MTSGNTPTEPPQTPETTSGNTTGQRGRQPVALTGAEEQLVQARTQAMGEALAELVEARDRMETAKEAFHAARVSAGRAVRRYGAALLTAEQPVERSMLRSLYWECPDLRAEDIGAAFGFHASEVFQYVGPYEQEGLCLRCGTAKVTRKVVNRSKVAERYPPWQYCAPCREVIEEEARVQAAQWRAERQAEEREIARMREGAIREGRYRVVRLLEYEDQYGMRTEVLGDDELPGSDGQGPSHL